MVGPKVCKNMYCTKFKLVCSCYIRPLNTQKASVFLETLEACDPKHGL